MEEKEISTAHDPNTRRDRVLELIAALKFCKAALFILVGLGTLQLLRPEVVDWADQLLTTTAAVYNISLLQKIESWVVGLSAGRLTAIGVGAFAYATLFLTEGVGLWLEKRWAEYLTVVATASLIPFELYEMSRKLTLPLVGSFVINVVVVAYLIYRIKKGPPKKKTAG